MILLDILFFIAFVIIAVKVTHVAILSFRKLLGKDREIND